jgi:hypothetical protein
MSGSRPEPELVTASAGMTAPGFSARRASASVFSLGDQLASFSGPMFEPLEAAAS